MAARMAVRIIKIKVDVDDGDPEIRIQEITKVMVKIIINLPK